MKTIAIAGLVAGLVLAGCASAVASQNASAAQPRVRAACFYANQVSGWRNGSTEDVVYLNVRAKDVYRLDMLGRCDGVDSALAIGVKTATEGSMICDGLDVSLVVRSSLGPSHCPVSKITKLTAEEVSALSSRKHP
ncbi:MAG: DUF6491 family protein [Caulobacter sp.]|nr:DUF6491 family protein [Caulobacter sp.]